MTFLVLFLWIWKDELPFIWNDSEIQIMIEWEIWFTLESKKYQNIRITCFYRNKEKVYSNYHSIPVYSCNFLPHIATPWNAELIKAKRDLDLYSYVCSIPRFFLYLTRESQALFWVVPWWWIFSWYSVRLAVVALISFLLFFPTHIFRKPAGIQLIETTFPSSNPFKISPTKSTYIEGFNFGFMIISFF